ncbi:helix-turn-helix domain-containing protein [Nocardia nova]|nr:helix-turn-helix transcriptional regulator [Nocardia nova]
METRGDKKAGSGSRRAPRAASAPATDADAIMSAQSPDQLVRKGGILRERRQMDLRRSLRAAAEIAGLSHTALAHYESGHRAPSRNFEQLDAAYGFVAGSVYNLYACDQIPVKAEPPPPPSPTLPSSDFPIDFPVADLIELTQADREFDELARGSDDPEWVALRRRYGRFTSRMLRRYVIAQAEGRRAAGVENDPFLSALLTTQLAREPLSDDEQERDELRYLKWLLGQTGVLSKEDKARYTKRFQAHTQGR